MQFEQFRVTVEIKPIKNTHLAVYPPEGRIRVAAPIGTSLEQVRLLLIKRRPWIEKQRRAFARQSRETPREYVYRETHYYKGRRYLLRIHPEASLNDVANESKRYLEVYIKTKDDPVLVKDVLDMWFRKQLKLEIDDIIERLGIDMPRPRVVVRDMKRKWGSYSKTSHTITLNLQLIKKPVECVEYVIAHELTHYREDKHGISFITLLSNKVPDWEQRRELLNGFPLSV